MPTAVSRGSHHRASRRTVAAAFLLGLGLHAVDQMVAFRAGPIPTLVTAPAVATLLYLHLKTTSTLQAVGLAVWGLVGSGLAVIAVFVVSVDTVLPRPPTGLELVVYDLGLLVWFVVALAVAYAVAARTEGLAAVAAVLAGPVGQAAFAAVPLVIVAISRIG